VAVNSATAGLHLALEALGIGPGDEVITTTHTFTATAEVVRYLGADVKLVDIDPATLCIDPAQVEAAITPRTKALVPVHYAGLAADMPALLAIARRHGLKVVEDAAHALPTTHGGRAGGHAGQRRHGLQLLRQQDHHHRRRRHAGHARRGAGQACAVMRLHGMSRDAFDRFTATVPSWYYEIVAPGFKYNLTDIAAALGLHQLQARARLPAAARSDRRDVRRGLRRPAAGHAAAARRPATCTPGTCMRCAWATMPASRATSSSRRCSSAASAAACTTSRCTCTPTGATATRCSRNSFRTASRPTSGR
jgi:dTDP-4-amino-4,6-dideoxygalactose transaminase